MFQSDVLSIPDASVPFQKHSHKVIHPLKRKKQKKPQTPLHQSNTYKFKRYFDNKQRQVLNYVPKNTFK